MPYVSTQYKNGYEAEIEHTRTTLRIFDKNRNRIFTAEITTVSEFTARLSNAQGEYNREVRSALRQQLKALGFKKVNYERVRSDGKQGKTANIGDH